MHAEVGRTRWRVCSAHLRDRVKARCSLLAPPCTGKHSCVHMLTKDAVWGPAGILSCGLHSSACATAYDAPSNKALLPPLPTNAVLTARCCAVMYANVLRVARCTDLGASSVLTCTHRRRPGHARKGHLFGVSYLCAQEYCTTL